jgi:hypothetical protein
MTQENVREALYFVEGTLLLNIMLVYVIFDPGASHSFISSRIVNELHMLPSKLDVGVTIITPLGENIDTDDVRLFTRGYEIRINMMPLN